MVFAFTLAAIMTLGGLRLFAFNHSVVTYPMRFVSLAVLAELCVKLSAPQEIVRNWFSAVSTLGLAAVGVYLVARRRHWDEIGVFGASRESISVVLSNLGWTETSEGEVGSSVLRKNGDTISIGSSDVPQFLSIAPSTAMRASALRELVNSIRDRLTEPAAADCPKMAAIVLWIVAAVIVAVTHETWVA